MPRNQKHLATLVRWSVGLGALVLAGFISFYLVFTKPELGDVDQTQIAQELTVFPAVKPFVNRQWQGYGLAVPMHAADVPSRLTATVTTKDPDLLAGVYVTPETVLAQLDADDYEQQVEIIKQVIENLKHQQELLDTEESNLTEGLALADESVSISEAELERVQALVNSSAARTKDLDDSRRALLQARQSRLELKQQLDGIPARRLALTAQIREQESNLKLAQLSQGRVTITSPISGILQAIDLDLGENIRAGERVARVVDLETLEIPIRLPASARASVKVGDKVMLSPSNGSSQPVEATIERLSPGDSTDARTITAYAVLKQPGANKRYANGQTNDILVPGQFLSATIIEQNQVCSFVVPRRSLRSGRVMVIRNDRLESIPVQTDFAYQGDVPEAKAPDDQWMVLVDQGDDSLLREGDQIVLNASTSAAVGDLVKAKPVPDANKSTSPAGSIR